MSRNWPPYQPIPDTECYSRAHYQGATWDAWLSGADHLWRSRRWAWVDRYRSTPIPVGGLAEVWRGYLDSTPDDTIYMVRTLWALEVTRAQQISIQWRTVSQTSGGLMVSTGATQTVRPRGGQEEEDQRLGPARVDWLPLTYPRDLAVGRVPVYRWSESVEHVPSPLLPSLGRVMSIDASYLAGAFLPPRLAAVEIVAIPAG